MTKRIVSLLLAVVLVCAMATVAVVSVSAAVDKDGCYVPSASIKKTQRLYFLMPDDWYNTKYNITGAGAYWWGGPDACGSIDGASVGNAWPGYKILKDEKMENLYYLDFPMDDLQNTTAIIFNNYFDGGKATKNEETGEVTYAKSKEEYVAAKQTGDVISTYYSEGIASDYYAELCDGHFFDLAREAMEGEDKSFLGDFADNFFIDEEYDEVAMSFNNMIYVIDPTKTSANFEGKETCVGEWYFYYGDGFYGSHPNREMAEKDGFVNELKAPAPTIPGTAPTVPDPAGNPTSSTKPAATSDTVKTDNGAIQTGTVSAIVVVFTILAVAGGAVIVARKRYE